MSESYDHNHDHDCGCGHDHDHNHDEDIIVVTDDEGNEHELVMVYTFEMEDHAYAVLIDRNNPEEDGFIFRIVEENDSAHLVDIEDPQEWERAAAVYNNIVSEDGMNQEV